MNISARNDPVAANPDLVPLFGKVPQGCKLNSGWTVQNLEGGAHSVLDYLNQKEVGDTVASEFQTAAESVVVEAQVPAPDLDNIPSPPPVPVEPAPPSDSVQPAPPEAT